MFLPYYSTDTHSNSLICQNTLEKIAPSIIIKYDNYYEEVADFSTFPFKKVFSHAPTIKKRGKNKDKINYYDLVATFDIETTTIKSDPPYSFMYQWQFCLESIVFMGRTWDSFQELLNIIKNELNLYISTDDSNILYGRALVIYIHNLSFEFQFMRHYLSDLVNPLFTDKYKPLMIPTVSGFVFRCSQRLFNKSLEKTTAGFKHSKLAGDLDYSIIRTPETPLTNIELAYCYNDVKGLAEAIRDRLDHDRYNIANIPLTSTGYVRKDCQRAVNSNPQNRKVFLNTRLNPQIYTLARDSFRGGNTHANALYNGMHLHDVASQDIASSYPAQIMLRTFPIGPWFKIDESDIIYHYGEIIKTHCIMLRAVFFNIKFKKSDNVPPLSISKCYIDKSAPYKEDNGRVYSAAKLETALTEIDLFIILKSYSISSIKILEAHASERGPLPKELREVCFQYYQNKTILKHSRDPEDIYNYNRAKELLNSIYGMMVQRVDRTEFKLINNEYIPFYKPLEDQLNEFYNSRSSFLNYTHGVYITSWARYQLQQGIDIVGSDFVYCDTDSVKYLNHYKYTESFNQLNDKLKSMAESAGAVAYDHDNNPVYIGIYDFEGIYTDFMTLGAKKYLYSYDHKNIHATISGVNKQIGQEYFTKHGFESFKDGQILAESGKLSAYYDDTAPHIININGIDINTASSVSLIDSSYTINVKGEYQEFINYLRKSVEQYYL